MTFEPGDRTRLDLAWMREYAEAHQYEYVHIRASEVLAFVEAVEEAKRTLGGIDRALADSHPGTWTHKHLQFCVGATLRLREKIDRFDEPDRIPGGDPDVVLPPDSRAESQAGSNGPSGSPTSPLGREHRKEPR